MQETWVGKIPWRRTGQPTPVFLPGECYGQRSLVGCSFWGHRGPVTIERLNNDKRWGQTEPREGAWLQGSPALETAPGTPTCSEARSPSFIFLGLGSGCTSLELEESQPVSTAACGYPMMQGLSIIKIWQGLPWWLRIYLPRLGTWVRSLVQEDPTGHGATKPTCRNSGSLCS